MAPGELQGVTAAIQEQVPRLGLERAFLAAGGTFFFRLKVQPPARPEAAPASAPAPAPVTTAAASTPSSLKTVSDACALLRPHARFPEESSLVSK